MIGFEDEPVHEKAHANEDPETKSLDKKDLYSLLSIRYFLPPIASRGVNRDYLIEVFKGTVFRVFTIDLKHFEVELSPMMTKRVGVLNNCFLVRKVNTLLKSRNQPPLGFNELDPPEEVTCSE